MIPADRLPSRVTVEGQTLTLKSEFHVSLLCLECIAKRIPQERAEELFATYVETHPIVFKRYVPEFRHAKAMSDESLVVRCEMANLEGLFDFIKEATGIEVPVQPAHVTLYTREPDQGIGIPTLAQMESYPVFEFPELFATLSA